MGSTSAPTPEVASDDRSTPARIRDAAIARFAADGSAATTVRAVAADAGVSPALVMHHFGSMDGLRAACDEHLVATIGETKHAAMAAGPGLDPLAALRDAAQGPPLLRYLARALTEGSSSAAALVDDMVADAERYMGEGVETGVLRPTDDPRGRAVVLTIWSLGALALSDHVERLLGADLTGGPEALAAAGAYFAPALEILSDGVLTEDMAAGLRGAFGDTTGGSTP